MEPKMHMDVGTTEMVVGESVRNGQTIGRQ